LQPAFEVVDERPTSLLSGSFADLGPLTPHIGLDRIELGDVPQRFLGDRCGPTLGELEEPTPAMRPAMGERDGMAALLGERPIGAIAALSGWPWPT